MGYDPAAGTPLEAQPSTRPRDDEAHHSPPRYRLETRLSDKPGAATALTVPDNTSVSTVSQNG
jgi:hypothetical protein